METANIKIFDLIGGAGPNAQEAVIGQSAETGKLSESGFAALFGDLVNGAALVDLQTQLPKQSQINAIISETINSEKELPNTAQLIEDSNGANQTKNSKIFLEQFDFELSEKNIQPNKEVKFVEIGHDGAIVSGNNVDSNQLTNGKRLTESLSQNLQTKPNIDVTEISEKLKQLNVKEVAVKSIEPVDTWQVKMPSIDSNGLKLKETVEQNFSNQNNKTETININQLKTGDAQSSFEQNEFTDKQAESKGDVSGKMAVKSDESAKNLLESENTIKSVNNSGQIKTEQSVSGELKTNVTQSFEKNEIGNKDVQYVKIIIPETAKLNSGQRHQSIMIRIEPDHLGPARLDLNLRHDVFSAKLTVETVEAKAVLEHSIHSLKEQLARADIKVEQIQINVRGETNYNQLFDRQPQWQKQSNMNQFRISNDEYSDTAAATNESFIPAAVQYVNTSGVNVLA